MGCFVVAEFLLTSASRGLSAIAEPLVKVSIMLTLNLCNCSAGLPKDTHIDLWAPLLTANP